MFLIIFKNEDDVGVKLSCLIIAIVQIDNILGVKDENIRFSFPIRIKTGK